MSCQGRACIHNLGQKELIELLPCYLIVCFHGDGPLEDINCVFFVCSFDVESNYERKLCHFCMDNRFDGIEITSVRHLLSVLICGEF